MYVIELDEVGQGGKRVHLRRADEVPAYRDAGGMIVQVVLRMPRSTKVAWRAM